MQSNFSTHYKTLPSNRRGVFLVVALVLLAILGIMGVSLTSLQVGARKSLARRERGRQAEYLARAGIEFALAEMLSGRNGEFRQTYEPIQAGRITVHVVPDAADSDLVQILSSAVVAQDALYRATRETLRRYRVLRDEAGKPRECVFVDLPQAPAAEPKISPESKAALVRALRGGVGRMTTPRQKDPNRDAQPPKTRQERLGRYNLGGPEIIPILVELLKDSDATIRRQAAEVLESFGLDARSAIPALRDALKDSDEAVRQAAARALKAIDAKAAADAGVP